MASKAPPPSDSGYATTTTEDHAELDVLDVLDLDESSPRATLKDLLLGEGELGTDPSAQLRHLVQTRIEEGHGETLFDLGLEDNGKSMNFSKAQWDLALDRLRSTVGELDADCRVLLTRNVGGDVEVGPLHEKDDSATGKVMIRVRSKGDGNVIETRIAVVGNGMSGCIVLSGWRY